MAVITKQKKTTRVESPARLRDKLLVLDFETTGLHPPDAEIIEIGAVILDLYGQTIDTFQKFVKPERALQDVETVHGITNDMLADADGVDLGIHELFMFARDCKTWWAHNAKFEFKFIEHYVKKGLMLPDLSFVGLCSLELARSAWPQLSSHSLDNLRKWARVYGPAHRALWDACDTATLIGAMMEDIGAYDCKPDDSLAKLLKGKVNTIWQFKNLKVNRQDLR